MGETRYWFGFVGGRRVQTDPENLYESLRRTLKEIIILYSSMAPQPKKRGPQPDPDLAPLPERVKNAQKKYYILIFSFSS